MDAPTVLGIESTAHTASVGVVQRTPDGRTEVRSNVIDPYSPEEGGIHSREAANHHADVLPRLIHEVMDTAGIRALDLAAVAERLMNEMWGTEPLHASGTLSNITGTQGN